MKAVKLFALSFFLSTAASSATLHALYSPPAGDDARDAPLGPRKSKPAPMPAPAESRHYAAIWPSERHWEDDGRLVYASAQTSA